MDVNALRDRISEIPYSWVWMHVLTDVLHQIVDLISDDRRDAKTLTEWNTHRFKAYARPEYPRKNGILCDQCGGELRDTDGFVLASNPPRMKVDCPSCGWAGYRIK